MKTLVSVFIVSLMAAGCAATQPAPSPQQMRLEERVDAFMAQELSPGIAVVVISGDGKPDLKAAAGVADKDGRPFTVETPMRIASNTKTMTAATVLRLWEKELLDLDAPIAGLVDPVYDSLLRNDGYDTDAITVRHLLMHTAGLPDHADGLYVEMIAENPAREWTRHDQVALLVENHDPLGPPNEQFSYSDTGYVLLGDIIERVAGAPLAETVRREMKFDELGLRATWWDVFESPPQNAAPRARQYLAGTDATDWHGSADLYGGGGLIMSMHDLALYMSALTGGEIFEKTETLETMLMAPGHPFPDKYRLGLFPHRINELDTFYHSGFWGSFVSNIPDIDITIAIGVLDQSGYEQMLKIVSETIEDISK